MHPIVPNVFCKLLFITQKESRIMHCVWFSCLFCLLLCRTVLHRFSCFLRTSTFLKSPTQWCCRTSHNLGGSSCTLTTRVKSETFQVIMLQRYMHPVSSSPGTRNATWSHDWECYLVSWLRWGPPGLPFPCVNNIQAVG